MNDHLLAVLEAREQRDSDRKALLDRFGLPLITLSVNMPGPDKNLAASGKIFRSGLQALETALAKDGMGIIHQEKRQSVLGPFAFVCVDARPERLKEMAVQIEEGTPAGRLLDIDVYRPGATQLSRRDLGSPGRTCLLCPRPAAECGRSRTHSVDELLAEIHRIVARLPMPCPKNPS